PIYGKGAFDFTGPHRHRVARRIDQAVGAIDLHVDAIVGEHFDFRGPLVDHLGDMIIGRQLMAAAHGFRSESHGCRVTNGGESEGKQNGGQILQLEYSHDTSRFYSVSLGGWKFIIEYYRKILPICHAFACTRPDSFSSQRTIRRSSTKIE